MNDDKPYCFRCFEEFPVADEPTEWQMGELRPLKKAPKSVQRQVHHEEDDFRGEPMLCGNCYFDLTDD